MGVQQAADAAATLKSRSAIASFAEAETRANRSLHAMQSRNGQRTDWQLTLATGEALGGLALAAVEVLAGASSVGGHRLWTARTG